MVDIQAVAEAHAHERRRLLAAFVCGHPSERPDDVRPEPSRPGRRLAAGAVLTALLTAGFAVPRVLAPPAPTELTAPGALLVDEHGRPYVVQEATDEPQAGGPLEVSEVANATSAMLLVGGDARAEPVTTDDLARLPRGPRVGIAEAPGAPPSRDDLEQGGWTACTGDGDGTLLDVGGRDDLSQAGSAAFVATARQQVYVVAEGHAFEVPDGPGLAPVLAAAAQRSADDLPDVPRAWIRLFPRGGVLDLAAFGLDDADLGAVPRARPRMPPDARVGDLLRPVGSDRADPAAYLVRGDDVLDLTRFALAVYRALPRAPGAALLREHDVDAPPGGVQRFVVDDPDLGWPEAPVDAAAADEVCAVLDTTSPSGPQVRLAVPAVDGGVAAEEGTVGVTLEPGHGALVGVADDSSVALVDDRGHLFALDEEARERLGYADIMPAPVPAPWLALLVPDVELSVEAAGCPVDARSSSDGC